MDLNKLSIHSLVELNLNIRRASLLEPDNFRIMSEMRSNGDTLETIAIKFGITRERVRQILKKYGGPDSSDARNAKRVRADLLDKQIRDKVLELMRRGIYRVAIIEKELGIPRNKIMKAVGKEISSTFIRTASQQNKWTDEKIVESIKVASSGIPIFTTVHYADALKTGLIAGPTLTVIFRRFGSWPLACSAAGVASHKRTGRLPAITKLRALDTLINFLAQNNIGTTAAEYEKWASARKQVSLGTLRNLFGSWAAALILARKEQSRRRVDQ